MTHYDFTEQQQTGVDVITFGTPEKTVSVDVTFIPAVKSYAIRELLIKDETGKIAPEAFAKIIALFTTDADAQWIIENTTYSTLDQIVAIIINKAFSKASPRSSKN